MALIGGCGSNSTDSSQAPSPTITLLIARSTFEAVESVVEKFNTNREKPVEIKISTGSSNGLARQIIAGAPADIFLSANKKWAVTLHDKGHTRKELTLLTNRVVLIVPIDNPAKITDPKELAGDAVMRVAIAGENVPAGIYAEQALDSLQLLEPLKASGRLARGTDVRKTLAFVERAEVEAGIVYATDAMTSTKVKVIHEFTPDSHQPIAYPLVRLNSPSDQPNDQVVDELFGYLQSAEAQEVFSTFGFTTAPSLVSRK